MYPRNVGLYQLPYGKVRKRAVHGGGGVEEMEAEERPEFEDNI